MATVTDVSDFQPHVRRQFILGPDIKGIAIANVQRSGIDINQREQRTRINILVAGFKDPRIAGIPIKGSIHYVGSLKTRRKAVGNAVEIGDPNREVNHVEGPSEYPLPPG